MCAVCATVCVVCAVCVLLCVLCCVCCRVCLRLTRAHTFKAATQGPTRPLPPQCLQSSGREGVKQPAGLEELEGGGPQ